MHAKVCKASEILIQTSKHESRQLIHVNVVKQSEQLRRAEIFNTFFSKH